MGRQRGEGGIVGRRDRQVRAQRQKCSEVHCAPSTDEGKQPEENEVGRGPVRPGF